MQFGNFVLFRRVDQSELGDTTDEGFSDVKVTGTASSDGEEQAEYQLSEIDSRGAFIPPSPISKSSFWKSISTSSSSVSASTQRSSLSDDNEPFSMSRESFDSYRRSFDISARSPIMGTFPTSPRQSSELSISSFTTPFSELEERLHADWPDDHPDQPKNTFEEVTLNEEQVTMEQPVKNLSRRRGLFSRFGENGSTETAEPKESVAKGISGFHFFSTRKQSSEEVVDAELESMSRPEVLFVAVED